MEELSSEKINFLRSSARSMVRELGLLNEAYFEIGVTLAERHLLIELSSCSCPTMKEIAEKLLLDKSTTSRLIARALKKGYIHLSQKSKDKRKRYLHLTELGRETLKAFEVIAFHQTQQALACLSSEEREEIYKGVFLYARGLKLSRKLKHSIPKEVEKHPFLSTTSQDISIQLAQKGCTLKGFYEEQEGPLYEIFRYIVETDLSFPYRDSSFPEFYRLFFSEGSQVYICLSSKQEVIGGFSLRPNFLDQDSPIANAIYLVKKSHQNQKIGTLLVKASLELAKTSGFQAMQFNRVSRQNQAAIKIYKNLGFKIIGIIPEAFKDSEGSYQEAYIFFRILNK